MAVYDYESIKDSMEEKAKALYNDIMKCYNLPKEVKQHKYIVNLSQEFITSAAHLYFILYSNIRMANPSLVEEVYSNTLNIVDLITDKVNSLHEILKDLNENNIR